MLSHGTFLLLYYFYCSGEKGNPTYVPPEVAVKTTEFAEEEVEIELDEEHSIQQEMPRNPLHTINAHQ